MTLGLISIGVVIGVVMGLTGSGGALIAIPLFMQILGMGLKEASTFSLIAVILASMFNFIPQRKNADIKVASLILPFSLVGSYISIPLKGIISDLGVALMLTLIALYSLSSVWKSSEVSLNQKLPFPPSKWVSALIGLGLGVLTTLTGLGGGVLLMPIFVGLLGFNQTKAVATSLIVVSLSSLFSITLQALKGIELSPLTEIFSLAVGIIVTVIMLDQLMKKLPKNKLVLIRKIVFSLVVLIAMAKIWGEIL